MDKIQTRTISTAIQEGHLQALDQLARGLATTRAHLIREAVRSYLIDHGARGMLDEPPQVAGGPVFMDRETTYERRAADRVIVPTAPDGVPLEPGEEWGLPVEPAGRRSWGGVESGDRIGDPEAKVGVVGDAPGAAIATLAGRNFQDVDPDVIAEKVRGMLEDLDAGVDDENAALVREAARRLRAGRVEP